MSGAILILAHAGDDGAALTAKWLRRELRPQAVRFVRPEALSLARWSHRVDARGRASTRFAPPRAHPVASADIGAVLNRIRHLPVPGFRRATAKDQAYAAAELQAVVASWLAELGDRVVHAVRHHPFVTPVLSLQRWATVAAACGLPVAARSFATSARAAAADQPLANADGSGHGRDGSAGASSHCGGGTVLVAGEDADGLLAHRYGACAIRAARQLGFPLLEFRFAVQANETVLVEVDPLPPLTEPWGAALAGRLLRSLAEQPPR